MNYGDVINCKYVTNHDSVINLSKHEHIEKISYFSGVSKLGAQITHNSRSTCFHVF